MKFKLMNYSVPMADRLGLDLVDLAILRWFDDFRKSGKMASQTIDNEKYYWIFYERLCSDMPVMRIKKSAVYKRLRRMVQADILKKVIIKRCGTYTYYAFGKNYRLLLQDDGDDSSAGDGGYDNNGSSNCGDGSHDGNVGNDNNGSNYGDGSQRPAFEPLPQQPRFAPPDVDKQVQQSVVNVGNQQADLQIEKQIEEQIDIQINPTNNQVIFKEPKLSQLQINTSQFNHSIKQDNTHRDFNQEHSYTDSEHCDFNQVPSYTDNEHHDFNQAAPLQYNEPTDFNQTASPLDKAHRDFNQTPSYKDKSPSDFSQMPSYIVNAACDLAKHPSKSAHERRDLIHYAAETNTEANAHSNYAEYLIPSETDLNPIQNINKATINSFESSSLYMLLLQFLRFRNPRFVVNDANSWLDVFDDMLNVRKLSLNKLVEVIRWAFRNSFYWCDKISKPEDIRDNYAQILEDMENNKSAFVFA